MNFPDTKIFKYRYDYESQPLVDFLSNRYRIKISKDKDILEDRVFINGQQTSSESIIKSGDVLEYVHHRADEKSIPLNFETLYEDEYIIAISKPDFLPVIPSNQFYFNSLVIKAKEYFSNPDLTPLHRLDIETSGILLFGKTKASRKLFQLLFQNQKITKYYQAITYRKIKAKIISGTLYTTPYSDIYTKYFLDSSGPDSSTTRIIKQCCWGKYHRVWCQPITGKTNQIRAHFSAIGSPIVGDKKYYFDESIYLDWYLNRDFKRIEQKMKLERQALHCYQLVFDHPVTSNNITIQDNNVLWQKKIDTLLTPNH
ncbi:MAG: RluA family pseudouridine synthase [Deltaproteobacteria bacterium]|jgi:RluA family pseudouridine synthase|nr:RluA family pseudouridine synthase [Deltaproteobacteria bacterium]MBT4526827.1 RluA family pseudouridine synthase [Deltaproteobacteria bacterium]